MSKRFSPALTLAISEASRKCFGNLENVNYRTGFKFLRRIPFGPIAASYYPPNILKPMRNIVPGFKTDEEERREEKLKRLRRRGKGPPRKGQGKRATRRK
jgi:small subunit ribosomal protein S33